MAPVDNEVRVEIVRDSDIVVARQAGYELATGAGFTLADRTCIATAISEVARNVMRYARRGEIRITLEEKDGRVSLLVEAHDEGPGIEDIETALEDGFSTSDGLGLGLPGARRLMDEFEIHSRPGEGTNVVMRKWVAGDA
jgi:serine/threonine-protein kinase RsbT